MKKISIAIDGPAAAGKSTVAKMIAEKLSYIYVDTGAMYRALTYKAIVKDIDINDEMAMERLLLHTTIELKPSTNGQLIFLDGEDVSNQIRGEEVTNKVSTVAAVKAVREEMVSRQQKFGMNGGVVMDGRDIGTKVMPNAELKIFLLASVDIRAERRHRENIQKGFPSNLDILKEEIMLRDKQDSEREISPLRKAEDAIELDTSTLSIEEVAAKIFNMARERIETK
ncbi:(d)CMP kinase [Lederbergia wuyishanensis]|uniref:Cytidylate kinase n=1 Tax=Lederbergia wuyishanensis TaxID=1347903 RepID=A0ABU0D110_9BACI|nr:(d)CMP kinase [Lederbergia wuyishanensis]MCJ8006690.1 (d)CMP kinase [Lederbergia wuyishanensis]MDQ0342072.1 cytidylate kinase [Lederbergia wuyishanensis]